uniref:BUD13 homolog n=1 Tax=Caenorhabditis tropicalis TaxID=1561998 RepID=A0A1I7URJ3_9PELO
MDDEDSLLERIAEVENLGDEDDDVPTDSKPKEEEKKRRHVANLQTLWIIEEKENDGEDGEVVEDGEKEDGELEDGELEDSDEEEQDGPPKRAPITAPSGTGSGRRPIEVGSNDNRLSRPLTRVGLPPITRNQPYIPIREEKSGEVFDNLLQDFKKSVQYHENPDAERDTPSPESEKRGHIPSLLDIRTHKPMTTKDLGPQTLYPSQRNKHLQHPPINKFKRDSVPPLMQPRGRTISQRSQGPPILMRKNSSKSPQGRGISFSPTKYNVEFISSDSDEEAFKKKPPRRMNSRRSPSASSFTSSSSKSTIPGVRSISSDSSDSSSKRRRARRRSRSNSRSRSRTYSSSSERGSSSKRRHMKRKGPVSPRKSRSRSPPPYPPGFKKNRKQDHLVTGDIHTYRIPKRGGGTSSKNGGGAQPAFLSQRSQKNSKKRQRSETPPMPSKRRKEEKSKKRRKDERAQTISDSESGSTFSNSSRKSRKRGKRRSPSVSSRSSRSTRSSSRSRSRSKSSDSSDSSGTGLPSRYRQKLPSEEKISSDEETTPTKKPHSPLDSPIRRSASSSPIRSPPRSSTSPEEEEEAPPPPPPPPPPPEEDEAPPPPPELSIKETRKELKKRLKTINKTIKINPEAAAALKEAQATHS